VLCGSIAGIHSRVYRNLFSKI